MTQQPETAEPYRFVDDDGDYLHIGIPHTPANGGPAISFHTETEPVHVPVEQIDDLIAALRRLVSAQGGRPEIEVDAIHTHFGLTYANYLVLPRTFLQSMSDQWQTQFVALLDQLHEAFAHVPQAECYEVTAGTEHIVGEMSDAELKQAGILADWYRGETPPDGLSPEELAEWEEAHEDPQGPAYSRNGEELDSHSRVLIPCADPVPHYNRGRTRIEPATP